MRAVAAGSRPGTGRRRRSAAPSFCDESLFGAKRDGAPCLSREEVVRLHCLLWSPPPAPQNQPTRSPQSQSDQPTRSPQAHTSSSSQYQSTRSPKTQSNQPTRSPKTQSNQPTCSPKTQSNQPTRSPPNQFNQSTCCSQTQLTHSPKTQSNQPTCSPKIQSNRPTCPPKTQSSQPTYSPQNQPRHFSQPQLTRCPPNQLSCSPQYQPTHSSQTKSNQPTRFPQTHSDQTSHCPRNQLAPSPQNQPNCSPQNQPSYSPLSKERPLRAILLSPATASFEAGCEGKSYVWKHPGSNLDCEGWGARYRGRSQSLSRLNTPSNGLYSAPANLEAERCRKQSSPAAPLTRGRSQIVSRPPLAMNTKAVGGCKTRPPWK